VYYPVIEFAQESIILPFPQEEIPEGYRAETLRCRGMDISTCTDGAEYLVKITDRSGKARVLAGAETERYWRCGRCY